MNADVQTLAHDYWEWLLRAEPTYATYLADFRYNDRLPDVSVRGRHQQIAELNALGTRVAQLQAAVETGRVILGDEEAITVLILRRALEDQLGERIHHFEQWALDQLMGPQVWLQELINYHPLKSAKDFEDLAVRYRSFTKYMDDYLENLRAGVAAGRTAPAVAAERVRGQLRDLLAIAVAESPLLPPSADPEDAPPVPDRARLREAVEAAIRESVYPAFERFLTFLQADYPAREAVGLSSLPGGPEAYAFRVRRHTTTALTPQEIHDLGMAMLRDVQGEMKAVARRLGHDGDLPVFLENIRKDPANCPTSREDLLNGYREILDEAQALLPKYFGRLPRVGCIVKPIEEYRERDCVAAYYYSPPDDFSRPGTYYANTYQPESRPRYQMTALTLHEAVPGHHLQIALAMEQTELPDFRRHSDFNAYIEGWALYTERLGVEMGMYKNDLSYFGMLIFQAWRICRLVVDTGMHALGWTRDSAFSFFKENSGLTEPEIYNEIDRYIIWPGQALSYAVGMREILRLRDHAEKTLGARFDLRAFHDEVLRHGALPLATLEKVVSDFVERRVAAHPV